MEKIKNAIGWLFLGFCIGILVNPKDNLTLVLSIILGLVGLFFIIFKFEKSEKGNEGK